MKKLIAFLFFISSAFAGYAPWGDLHWAAPVASVAALPVTGNLLGDVRLETTDFGIYCWEGSSWNECGGGGGTSVSSLNSLTGALSIVAGSGVSVSAAGSSITVSAVNPLPSPSPSGSPLIATGTGYVIGSFPVAPSPVPAGSSSDVQFNSSGAFAGNSGFTYDGSGNATLSGKSNSASANISGLTASEPVVSDASKNLVSGSVSSPLTYSANAFGCQSASGSQAGCLSSTDWSTFNGKQAALSFTAPLVDTANTVTCNAASGSQSGCLSSTDWTTFNSKSPAGNYATSGSGDVSWSAPSGPGAVTTSLVATTNSTLATLSGLTTASSLATVGTITSGTWHGSAIGVPYGGTGVTSVTSAPTASAWAGWDANSNLSANNNIPGYATTATAAGTTTLTVGSAQLQYFTGSTTQTVKLPVASTLALGQSFIISNLSTGAVTVQSSGSNTIGTISSGAQATFTCILTSGTTAASWNYVTNSSSANVTSTTAGTNYHMESVAFGGGTEGTTACSSGSCTIYRSTGGVSGVTWNSTGSYTVGFVSGTFSTAPICVATDGIGNSTVWASSGSDTPPTATSFFLRSTTGSSGSNTNSAAYVICMGPH